MTLAPHGDVRDKLAALVECASRFVDGDEDGVRIASMLRSLLQDADITARVQAIVNARSTEEES